MAHPAQPAPPATIITTISNSMRGAPLADAARGAAMASNIQRRQVLGLSRLRLRNLLRIWACRDCEASCRRARAHRSSTTRPGGSSTERTLHGPILPPRCSRCSAATTSMQTVPEVDMRTEGLWAAWCNDTSVMTDAHTTQLHFKDSPNQVMHARPQYRGTPDPSNPQIPLLAQAMMR